jgi:hypothetical protein
MDESRFMS